MDWMRRLLEWLNGENEAKTEKDMKQEKKQILVVLKNGTHFWDGSGKPYSEWYEIMNGIAPKTIDFVKENGTHACFSSSEISYIEERLENE